MNPVLVAFIVKGAVIGALFAVIVWGLAALKRLIFSQHAGDQEALQAFINVKANEQPVGPGVGIGRERGFRWWLWFAVGCLLAYLLIFSANIEGILV